jgi:microcystin degradation protein MlrC
MALSPGVSNEVIEALPFHRVRRPIYPLDGDFAWDPRQTNQ